jgi:hypothetical protein
LSVNFYKPEKYQLKKLLFIVYVVGQLKFEEKPQFRIYRVMTVTVLLFGSETWVSRERGMRRLLAEVGL